MPLLEVKDLQVRVEEREILHGLSLTVNLGEVHAIMGPNGSGKSTLSHVIAGKPGYEVTGGEILYKGENLLEMAPDERAAKGVVLEVQYRGEVPGGASMSASPAARRSATKCCRWRCSSRRCAFSTRWIPASTSTRCASPLMASM